MLLESQIWGVVSVSYAYDFDFGFWEVRLGHCHRHRHRHLSCLHQELPVDLRPEVRVVFECLDLGLIAPIRK
jgi:hypothetical protein